MGYVQLGLRGRQQSSTRWKPLQNRKPTGWAKALASGKRAPIGIFWHTSAEGPAAVRATGQRTTEKWEDLRRRCLIQPQICGAWDRNLS